MRKHRILVVDDEPDMLDILKTILTQADFEVYTAQSGKECLEKTSHENYDLILLDIRMPQMDGWTALKKLKERGVTDKTKVVILTVEKGPGVEIFGLQDVVEDYITKPFDRQKLIKHIKKALV